PRDNSRLQHPTAPARIPPHNGHRPVRTIMRCQHTRRTARESERKLRGQIGVRQSTHPVSTEHPSHDTPSTILEQGSAATPPQRFPSKRKKRPPEGTDGRSPGCPGCPAV